MDCKELKMTVDNKLISVVCATKNAGKTLARMLDSYAEESTSETELIVIDSCSTDNSEQIFNQYSSHISELIVEKDRSIYEAWNKGIAASKGDYICFIGADDRISVGAIAALCKTIKEKPEADYIHGFNIMCRNGYPVGLIGRKYTEKTLEHYMPMAHVMSAHKKSWLLMYGNFDSSFKSSGDYDFLLRTRKHSVFEKCDSILAFVEDAGISRNSILPFKESHIARVKNGVNHWKSLFWYSRGLVGMYLKKIIKLNSI